MLSLLFSFFCALLQNVETQFGSETYLLFLRGLEEESDIQIVRILDHFESE